MNKKVAVVGLKGLPAFGGAAAVGENIINELKNKYEFVVLSTSSHTNLSSGEYNGVTQIVFKKIPFLKLNTLYYYFRCTFHLLFNKYDLVHWHHSDAVFLLWFVKLRNRSILTTHGAFNAGLSPKWQKFYWFFKMQLRLVKLADKICVVSLNEKRLFLEKYNIEVHYIPNGISPKTFHSIKEKSSNNEYLFFAAARLMKSKGLDLFIEALNELKYQGKVLVAGQFVSNEYEKYIKDISKNIDIVFIGLVTDKEVLNSLLYNCKLFVYPTYREAMSMMMLEAAAVKACIICSDIQENKDIFTETEVTFFNTGDANSLKSVINYSLDNYAKIIEKAEFAYEKLVHLYNWKNIALEYSKQYDILLNDV